MNILFISRNSPFTSVGGIERYISNLIAYFQINQKNSRLYLMLPGDDNKIQKMENVTIIHDECLFLSRNNVPSQKEISQKAVEFAKVTKNIIKDHNINIICCESFHTDLPATFSLQIQLIASVFALPIILQLHSFAKNELQTQLINELGWSKISCVSQSVAGDCFQKGAEINRLSIHYLGVDTDTFTQDLQNQKSLKKRLSIPINNKIILTATRIIGGRKNILKEKGVVNLIAAFSSIAKRYPEFKLLIAVGTPPKNLKIEFQLAMDMLKGYLQLYEISNQTIIKTFKLHEMPLIYQGSDLFVLASQNETFGQVFIEGMSSGVAVIGTKVGGIPEIISDNYNGLLVEPDDASILVQKIEKMMTNDDFRQKLILNGQKTVKEKFSSKMQFDSFYVMLKNTISAHKSNNFRTNL